MIVILWGGPAAPDEQVGGPNRFAAALAGQGAVVIIASWRQAASYGGGYPESFADVACAIGVARLIGPAYGAVPERVTLLGYSLGGWPATVVGLTPTPFMPEPGSCDPTAGSLRPDAVVSLNGATSISVDWDFPVYLAEMLGGDEISKPDVWAAVNPIALAQHYRGGPGSMPFMIIQAADDTNVWPEGARSLAEALIATGHDSHLVMIPDADHLEVLERKQTIGAIMSIAKGD